MRLMGSACFGNRATQVLDVFTETMNRVAAG
jgi:hypothetical protein